jgi:hypothetical protein
MNIPGFIREKFGLKKAETTTIQVDGHKVEVDRLDSWLPQGLRIGSIISLNENWFYTNEGLGGTIPKPEELTGTIQYLSYVDVDSKIRLFRAFINPDLFLQFTIRKDDKHLEEIHLFSTVYTDFPQEWETVLGPDGLGQMEFYDSPGNRFYRVTGANSSYEKPQEAEERGIFDPAGQKGWITDLSYHFYQRILSDDKTPEFLLIQVEDVREENGQPGDRASVTYSLGIELPVTTSLIPTHT